MVGVTRPTRVGRLLSWKELASNDHYRQVDFSSWVGSALLGCAAELCFVVVIPFCIYLVDASSRGAFGIHRCLCHPSAVDAGAVGRGVSFAVPSAYGRVRW